MLIIMQRGISEERMERVLEEIRRLGLTPHPMPGPERLAIGITGHRGPLDPGALEALPGVARAIRLTEPYTLVSREARNEDTVIEVAGRRIGGGGVSVIAGPCAVESLEQMLEVARLVKEAGAHFLRGGAFKPRTSPYSFQGLGEEGLRILDAARRETGLPVVTEVLDTETVGLVAEHADVLQIGARNMQNFSLLKKVGRTRRPVMLKRGMSATIEELLMSAEYIAAEGNSSIFLCERGVRTFSSHTRNTLDLSAVAAVKHASHLPIIVDPSHGTGHRDRVPSMALAAAAAGADGVMIEVHSHPERALSDGPQAMLPDRFRDLMVQMRSVAALVGKTLQPT